MAGITQALTEAGERVFRIGEVEKNLAEKKRVMIHGWDKVW